MALPNKKTLFSVRFEQLGRFILQALVTRTSGTVLLILALSVLFWLAYVNIWTVLQSDTVAAGSAVLEVPVVRSELLDRIGRDRDERTRHTSQSYTAFIDLFASAGETPLPSITPVPTR